ncbi:NAD(P)/FAD-dependent oxidoreductase [Saccharopolyspora erythraea]|uniref:NAD(P)-binding domain-containing protein n=1 Tax=Saccharopolyspora erythraea TaxID=1836 RepID=UPI001BA94CD4|nr:NAD(P)-binding domain-containing protein [Saccharopolyspora erythraea]QUH02667.1 NAD(P)/FAD-dependent oxidoreductase [Saccharopolyspora erythraea]
MNDNDLVDVAIVGAGPYGLSLAAHLRANGVSYRQFGVPMGLWRTAMPRGMYLKSQGFASNLSDPDGTHSLRNFCRDTGRTYADYGVPVSLDTFVSYGEWFRLDRGLEIDERLVTDVRRRDEHFDLTLADGEQVRARNVVVAAGVEHFARLPEVLDDLPTELCTHSSEHTDLSVFQDREVIVVGAGQSALETAALLHEHGARTQMLVRAGQLVWNGRPLLPDRPLLQRMREPEAGLGSGLSTWFYSEHPRVFRRLPKQTRVYRARTALGPAGAWWLRERVEGKFPVRLSHGIDWAVQDGHRVRLGVRANGHGRREFEADHVIGATGYPPSLARLSFLGPQLRSRLSTLAGTPRVGRDFQSSVPGLFFVGAVVAPEHGPVMRFVYGADYAVRQVSGRLSALRSRRMAVGGVGR